MSILTEKPPVSLLGVPIRADFREMIRLDRLLLADDLPEGVRVAAALEMFYCQPVEDIQAAWDKMLWFWGGGESGEVLRRRAAKASAGRGRRLYDFEQDAELIYAAFWGQYGIDLAEMTFLHWWKFRALFLNLDEQQQISRIMGWRGADTGKMGPKMAAEYKRLKRIYGLNKRSAKQSQSLAERDRDMRRQVAKMFAEAGVARKMAR